jgi:diguanylate cyclase (GGDEF)-like protein
MRSRDAESTMARLRVEHQLETARQTAEIARLRTIALEREAEQANLTAAKLDAQASLDALTGLFNRRHASVLESELRQAVEEGEPVALVLFDVDRFKVVNDTHGHTVGDRALVQIASQLRSGARKNDMPCRWGGDEFLLLLVGMDVDGAAKVAERIRRDIAESELDDGGTPVKMTISAGVAGPNGNGEADLERLIAAADRALYRAKADGRDRVSVDAGV